MKRFFALLLCALMLAVVLSGCAKTTQTPAPSEGTTPAQKAPTILMFTSANVGDFRVIDSAYSGVQDTSAKFGYDYDLIELGGDMSIAESSLDDACSSGKYQYVITGFQGMKDVYEAMAKKYPEVTFIMYDVPTTYEVPSSNMIGISFKQNDGSYLAGIYSALMTTTGKVAVGLWDDNPILNDFGTGFVNGVKYANDTFGLNVQYKVVYYGGDSTDATAAYELVNTVYNDGYDIFYNVAGHVVLSACKACEEHGGYEKGNYVIGVDTDQWMKYEKSPSVDAYGYENIAVSVLKDAQTTILNVFEGLNDGSIKPGDLVITGLVEGGVRLSDNEHYKELTSEEIVNTVKECEDQVASGEKTVLSYFDFDKYEDYALYRDDPAAR